MGLKLRGLRPRGVLQLKLRGLRLRGVLQLKLQGLRPRGVLQLKLRGLRLRDVLQLKLRGLRPRGVLQLLQPLLPVQTVLTSLGMEVTTLECKPLTSRLSIKSENGDFTRTSEECDILPTTTDSMTLRLRPA